MNYARQPWRLLITPPARGAWNMAVDETLLEVVGRGLSLPCLRLFAWEPACLSIGYAQPSGDVDRKSLDKLGWDWVRRPTGGRAILHTDELTYSVIAPLSEPRLVGSVLESYQRLSTALLAALRSMGIPAQANPIKISDGNPGGAPICFEVPSNYEIVVDDKKLVGSAQARRKEGVLQHGTLPLWGDLGRITQVLRYSSEGERGEAGRRLLAHATTVETVLGQRIEWSSAAQAFVSGFQSMLNIEFINSELSDFEISRVNQLAAEKYSQPSWLERI